jgi:LruC domain-containing protein
MRRWMVGLAVVLMASPAAWAQDSDGDGTQDGLDLFPCDGSAVGQAFAPAQGVHGMLQFEDYFPVGLDEDFNDVVVTYNAVYATDAAGQVTRLRLTLNLLAAGGFLDHGLGLALPVPASSVASAVATLGSGAPTVLGLSAQDSNATFVLSGDLRADFFGTSAKVINADPAQPVLPAGAMVVDIAFSAPVALAPSAAPHDLFIFRSNDTGHEIHQLAYCGTAGMKTSLFGTGVDASNPSGRGCFVDVNGLPFVLHMPEVVAYPTERTGIAQLYPEILLWAASGGTSNTSFYLLPQLAAGFSGAPAPAFIGGDAFTADYSCQGSGICNGDGVKNGTEAGVDCGPGCGQACLRVQVEGHADVLVGCAAGDYSCQARLICNAITGYQCVHQAYDCWSGNQGSWYPPDGASGSSAFNFAYAYDFGGGNSDYGNICACTTSQMTRYGLAANHQYCGVGHWTRVTTPQTCTDGVLNQDELEIDCGGSCPSCVGTCSDGVRNQGETGVDCGGPNCAACPSCSDGVQNQGETAVDCGGPNCTACPTCSDGIRNQGETGVDCGGPCGTCPGLPIQVEGWGTVYANCANGDYSCQAKAVCETVTGYTCVHQAYECWSGSQGSWYPTDGVSGSSAFNFAYAYDFGGGNSNYGNICACTASQMTRYGLAATHQYCGLGHWTRVP